MRSRCGALVLTLTLASLGATGCVAPALSGVGPRFDDDVAAAIARDPMRRMETPDLVVYYPEHRREEATRAAARIERCAEILKTRAFVRNGLARRKMVLVMPEVPYNNAFVQAPSPGLEPVSVVPLVYTFDFQSQAGMPPDPSSIGCHEITHYVHGLQIRGIPWLINLLLGNTFTPQDGLDPWFWEGLATYYETALQPGAGRLAWPFWTGVFHAGVAHERLGGGDLNVFNRDFSQGGQYLVGAHFVAFLMERYGEAQVWSLIHEQGAAFPLIALGVSGRFEKTFGKSLSALIDEFADEVARRYPARPRPAAQHTVHGEAGRDARYARGLDGTEALVFADRDRPTTLAVFDARGRLVRRRSLNEIAPPRTLKAVAVADVTGLAVAPDGRSVYFTAIDLGVTYQVAKLVRYDVVSDTFRIVVDDLQGAGGGLLPDGKRYLYAWAEADRRSLGVVDLATGTATRLASLPPRNFIGTPHASPRGERAVAGLYADGKPQIGVFEVATGKELARLATRGPVDDPSFVDESHVVYLGTVEGRFQVFVADLTTGESRPVTDVPYLASNPQVVGDSLRFLNREGFAFTLDEVALPPAAATAPATPSAPPPAQLTVVSPPIPPEQPAVLDDAPASALEHVFVPQGVLLETATVSRGPTRFLLGLGGGDRLDQHRWLVEGGWQTDTSAPSFGAAYGNRQLAPFSLQIAAAHTTYQSRFAGDASDAPLALERKQDAAAFSLSRAFWGNPVSLGATVLRDRWDTLPEVAPVVRERRTLAGPTIGALYQGAERTPYSGARRLLYGAVDAGLFPRAWNTTGDTFSDLRAEAGVTIPVAPFRLPTLSLRARGRWLAGTGGSWIQLGGFSAFSASNQKGVLDPSPLLPESVDFAETLRGYEDVAFFANRVAIADGTLRFPVIIDRGTASTLGFLPSLFFRQIDLNLFGAVGSDGRPPDANGLHVAAGASSDLAFAIWLVPLRVRFQVARRFTDDRAWAGLVGLALGQ